jgi:hypothetical protein
MAPVGSRPLVSGASERARRRRRVEAAAFRLVDQRAGRACEAPAFYELSARCRRTATDHHHVFGSRIGPPLRDLHTMIVRIDRRCHNLIHGKESPSPLASERAWEETMPELVEWQAVCWTVDYLGVDVVVPRITLAYVRSARPRLHPIDVVRELERLGTPRLQELIEAAELREGGHP